MLNAIVQELTEIEEKLTVLWKTLGWEPIPHERIYCVESVKDQPLTWILKVSDPTFQGRMWVAYRKLNERKKLLIWVIENPQAFKLHWINRETQCERK